MCQLPDTTHKRFLSIYESIPRQGPGSSSTTLRALSMVPALPKTPRVLDVGCGKGAPTLTLAEALPQATITAVDQHLPFIEKINEEARRRGWQHRVTARQGDMNRLEFPDRSFDLVWSEGAIYIMGFEAGLRSWRRLLAPGATLAASHFTWFTPNPPKECVDFFGPECPTDSTLELNLAIIQSCGYASVGHFAIPASDWLDEYYAPAEARIAEVRSQADLDSSDQQVLDGILHEADLYRRYGDTYGYVFFVLRQSSG